MTRADQYRATRKETALWLLERLVPDTAINNVAFALRVDGRFRTPDLQAAVDTVVDRYEILRTVFVEDEGTLIKRVEPAMLIPLTESEAPEAELQRTLDGFAAIPFALDGQPLLRIRLVRTPTADVLCVAAHHLIFDAISSTILLRAVIAVYEQIGSGLPPLADTIPARVEPPASERSLAYWRAQLSGFTPGHQELALRGELISDGHLRGGTVTRDLSATSLEALRTLQKQVRCPEAAVLLAAYAVLLTTHGAGHDVVLGAPVDVRQERTPTSIGYHINVLPIRLTLDRAETFRGLARRSRDTFLAALAHADASVDDLLAELPRLGSSWRDTLYRHLFNYVVDTDGTRLTVDGMPARAVGVENGNSKFDLELFVTSGPGGVRLRAAYYRGALRQKDAERFLERFEALLVAAAADPEAELGRLDAWAPVDHHVITVATSTGARALVVDDGGRPLPVGVVGEVCEGDRRTGRLGRWTAEGGVESFGRIDRNVKIRGAVLALDQIETQLRSAGRDDVRVVPGDGDATVLAVAAEPIDELGVEDNLRALLPPAATVRVVRVPRIPYRPDGTVDHNELRLMADAEEARPAGDGSLESTLLRIWQALLPEVAVTPATHFFLEGGHSLLAAKLAQDIEDTSGISLELPDIFEHPTPAELARHLQAASAA